MSFREVVIGPCRLINADSLAALVGVSDIDAVITDPPYSSGGAFRSDRSGSTSAKYLGSNGNGPKVAIEFEGDSRDGRGWLFWSTLWMLQCHEACKPSALAMLFTDWRQMPQCSDVFQAANWVWRGCAVWDKGNARPMSGRFSHQAEFILWGSKGAIGWDFEKPCLNGVLQYPAPKEYHQTEKPVELLKQMMSIVPTEGLVLDPFMGSGTTGVACIETGRSFIGIEKSPEYFEVSCQRIQRAWDLKCSELPFEKEPPARQLSLIE